MICPNCKAQLPDEDDPFCAFCGAPIPRPAPQPAPAPTDDQARRTTSSRRSPLVTAAVVSSVVALVSVIALVLVVIRPFDALEPAGDDTIVTPPTTTNVYPDDGGNGASGGGSEGEGEGGSSNLVDTDTIIGVGGADGAGDTIDTDDATDPADDSGNGTNASDAGGTSGGAYVLADSDSRRYSTEELESLSNWELYLARNEIYARRGREFRNDDLARYFSSQTWYEPTYSPDNFDARQDSILSDVERDNAQTILALEQARGSEYV